MSEMPLNVGPRLDEPSDAEKELAQKYKDTIVDIQSKLFDKSSAYNNLIMVGGYAAAFTVWSYTKSWIPSGANVLTALLLIFSLAIFIIFQVFKMVRGILHYNEVRRILHPQLALNEFFERYSKLDRKNAEGELRIVSAWSAVTLFLCVTSGLLAMSILAYYFILQLCGMYESPLT